MSEFEATMLKQGRGTMRTIIIASIIMAGCASTPTEFGTVNDDNATVGVGGGASSSGTGGEGGEGGDGDDWPEWWPMCEGTEGGQPGMVEDTNLQCGAWNMYGYDCDVTCLPLSTAVDACWPDLCASESCPPEPTWGEAPSVKWQYIACEAFGGDDQLGDTHNQAHFAGVLFESGTGAKLRCGNREALAASEDAFPGGADAWQTPTRPEPLPKDYIESVTCPAGNACTIVRRWRICDGCEQEWFVHTIPGVCHRKF